MLKPISAKAALACLEGFTRFVRPALNEVPATEALIPLFAIIAIAVAVSSTL